MINAVKQLRIVGDVAYVPLSKGYEAIIDVEDAQFVGRFNWTVVVKKCNRIYAWRNIRRNGKQTTIYLHREVMNAQRGQEVDHIDGDGLNNRRVNLRITTHQQNLCNQLLRTTNKSGFKGVSWAKDRSKWRAQITVNYKMKYLGSFKTKEMAHAAYIKASMDMHCEFGSIRTRGTFTKEAT